MSGMLQSIGVIMGLWGVLWYMWDHQAGVPIWLMGCGLLCLATGSLLL